jgi:regulator of replication initiation timing
LTDTASLDYEAERLQDQIADVSELIRQSVNENTRLAIGQTEYNKRYSELITRYQKAKDRLERIEEQRKTRQIKKEQMNDFISSLRIRENTLSEFDENL